MEYFWGGLIERPTKAQSFFLVERVSNVRSKLLVNKIVETARSAKKQGLMSESDLISLAKIYEKAVQDKKIIASQEDLLQLIQQISI